MSTSAHHRDGRGRLLREVALDPRPRALRSPSGGAAPVSPPDGQSAAAPQPAPNSFDEGFRCGFAEGEAAQRARSQENLQAVQARAFEQGLEDGRQRGLAEGETTGRQLVERAAQAAQAGMAARLAQLDRLLASLPGELTRRLEDVEDDMVALCHAVVCRILGEELVTPEGVAHHVRQAIRDAGPSGPGHHRQLAIHLHPRDLAGLQEDATVAGWLRQHAGSAAMQWVADEQVRLGGCLVRSAEGSLDARVETQLAALGRLLASRSPRAAVGGANPPSSDAVAGAGAGEGTR